MQQPDLSLMDVFLLDKVKKRLPVSAADVRGLRARKLIEDRTPRLPTHCATSAQRLAAALETPAIHLIF